MTLKQRFGSALNPNIHFHMLFLDGIYVERPDGSVLPTAELHDRPALVMFFTSWCSACKKSLPSIKALVENYKDKPVRFLAISQDMIVDQPVEGAEYPMDPVIRVAELGLKYIDENIVDYTATIAKQERVKGKLLEKEYIQCKIRNRSEQHRPQ